MIKCKYLLLIFLLLSIPTVYGQKIEIYLFGGAGCKQCKKLESGIVSKARKLYPKIVYHKIITDDIEGFKKLIQFEKKYNDERNKFVKVFVGRFPDKVICLAGEKEINAKLLQEISKLTSMKQAKSNIISIGTEKNINAKTIAQKRLEHFTIGAVISAGLLDGINPCVFSTMVFLMGLLAGIGVKGRRMLMTGLTFCLGSFIMYTSMGFGILQALRMLDGFTIVQVIIKSLMVLAMGYFAIIAFRDAVQLRKSGYIEGEICNLPIGIIGKIHKIIRNGLSGRWIISGAFGCGMVITLFESMCTGQVYAPTLLFLIRSGVSELTSWFYLILFNIACILPLVAVFILVYRGLQFESIEKIFRRNLFREKIILVCFFIIVGILITVL